MDCINDCITGNRFTKGLKACCSYTPARYVLAIMAFFGTFHVYLLRVNLSVAIVAMVDYDGLEMQDFDGSKLSNNRSTGNNTFASTTLAPEDFQTTDKELRQSCGNMTRLAGKNTDGGYSGKKFLWDGNMQGLALGSYFYGYVCSQVIGAWLGRKLGLVRLWGCCMLVVSALTMLTPAALEFDLTGLVVTRVIIGLFSGVSYPILHGLMSMWAPPSERGKILVIQFAGSPVGSAVALPLCGYLSNIYGWQSSFYVTGASGLVWTIFLLMLIRDSPADSFIISESEKEYIESSLQQNQKENDARSQLQRSVPWRSLLLSIRVWSTVIPHFSANFGTYIFLTMLPTYLRTVMNIDVKASGALSAIPYVSKICLYPFVGMLTDYVIAKGIRPIVVRKTWTSIATFTPGLALIAASYTGCHLPLLIFFFSIPDALDTFTAPGYKTAMIEIAPAFAAIIFAIANTVANASGFLTPQIAGALREHNKANEMQGWNALFWLGAVSYFIGGLAFLIFGTSELQNWAASKSNSDEEIELAEKTLDEENKTEDKN